MIRSKFGRRRRLIAGRASEWRVNGTPEIVAAPSWPERAASGGRAPAVAAATVERDAGERGAGERDDESSPPTEARRARAGAAFLQPDWTSNDRLRPEIKVLDLRDGSKLRYRFAAPQVVIGTAEEVHLRLRDDAMEPRHAVLQALHGGVLCLAGGPGGLEMNRRSSDALLITCGRRVRLGSYELTLRLHAPPPAGTPRVRLRWLCPDGRGIDEPSADGVRLVSERSGKAAILTPARPVLTVGGRRGAGVVLRDHGADALHALALHGPDGPWVVDLRSRIGTQVNGEPVHRRRLKPGDEVSFGDETVHVTACSADREAVAASVRFVPR